MAPDFSIENQITTPLWWRKWGTRSSRSDRMICAGLWIPESPMAECEWAIILVVLLYPKWRFIYRIVLGFCFEQRTPGTRNHKQLLGAEISELFFFSDEGSLAGYHLRWHRGEGEVLRCPSLV
jgi:hypothetical protein